MDESQKFKAVLRRASTLFVAVVAAIAIGAVTIWWHHARMSACPAAEPLPGNPASCYYDVWFFGPSWAAAIALLLVLFGVCMLMAWIWPLLRRQRAG